MTVQPRWYSLLINEPSLSPSTALTAGTLAFSQRELLFAAATLCMASASWLTGTTTLRDHAWRRILALRPPPGADTASSRRSLGQSGTDTGTAGTPGTGNRMASRRMTSGRRLDVNRSVVRRMALGAAAGLGPVVIFPGPLGMTAGIILGIAAARLLASVPDQHAQRRQARLIEDLPLALDLIAACLTAGAPIVTALGIVADAVGGPLGAELDIVSRGLRLGASAAEACSRLLDPGHGSWPGPGWWARLSPARLGSGKLGPPIPAAGAREIAAFARALHRTEESGARLAVTLGRLADQTRARQQERALAAARRAGVSAVAPLGLCFLPAFIALGVVPVVIGAGSGLALP